MPPRLRAFAGLVALALVGSCVAHDTPTGVGEALLPAGIVLQPALIPSPADSEALAINRIRAVVIQVPGGVVLKDTTVTVQPADPAWTLDIRVPLAASPTLALAYFYLMNQGTGGAPTVEFSGVTDTLTLAAGQSAAGGDIPIVRGPLANLYVTGVSITSTSPVVAQGQTLGLTATVTTSASTTPTVFWTSLDTSIARFVGATVTGVAPGVTDVVASAGAHADTTSLVVQGATGGQGAIIAWLGGSGTWSTPSLWSLGRVPQAGDTVRIVTGVDYQVTLDTDVTVASLQIGGTADLISLVVGDFDLVLTDTGPGTALDILPLGRVTVGNANVTAPSIHNDGSFDVLGVATLTSTLVRSAGQWSVAAGGAMLTTSATTLDFRTSGTLTLEGSLSVGTNQSLTYQGGTLGGAGVLFMTSGSQLILEADLAVDGPLIYLDEAAIPGASSRLTIGPSSLLYLLSSGGNFAEVNVVTTNQGLLYASGPSSYLNDSLYVDVGATVYVDAAAAPSRLGTGGVDNAGAIGLIGSFDATFGPGSSTGQLITNRATGEIDLVSSGMNIIDGQLINEGTVNVAGPSQLRRTTAQGLHVAAQHLNSGRIDLLGGTLDVILGGTSPSITSTGTITVGSGTTLRVTNTSNPPGQIINGPTGVLMGTGTVDLTPGSPVGLNDGSIAPGLSPGALTWSGNVPMGSSGTIDIELSGTTPGTGYDQLNIGEVLLLDYQSPANGTLNVTTPGFTPQDGDRFAVLTFGVRSGNFANVVFPEVPGITFDTVWTSGQAPDTLYVTATAVATPPVLQPSELCSSYPPTAIATFADASLDAAVRTALGITAQDALTCQLLGGLTQMTASSAGIADLVGLQNATGLSYLDLSGNAISDVRPLSDLTSLSFLSLNGNAGLTDISPLASLSLLTTFYASSAGLSVIDVVSNFTQLTSLALDFNSITDLTPLSGLASLDWLGVSSNVGLTDIGPLAPLSNLKTLSIANNAIDDISALSDLINLTLLSAHHTLLVDISSIAGLTALDNIWLHNNAIVDISPLQGLTAAAVITLNDNTSLRDIQPLFNNEGLGAGDSVNLTNTAVICTDVTALRGKGVAVTSTCP